jgi:hypothetical protein
MIESHAKRIAICEQFLKDPSKNFWKDYLFTLLPYKPYPLLVTDEHIVPAAALWSYLRVWKDEFRKCNAQKGHTIILSLNPSLAWVTIFLSAIWEDLTIILCEEKDLPFVKSSEHFATFSMNKNESTWAFSENLEPIPLTKTNPDALKSSDHRVLFYKNATLAGITDQMFTHLLINLDLTNAGQSVLSTLPWSSPIGFYYDFFLSFFCEKEIYFSQNKNQTIDSQRNDPSFSFLNGNLSFPDE